MIKNKKRLCTSKSTLLDLCVTIRKIQSLRTTRVDYRCMKGRTPKERKEREALFKRLMTQDQNSTRSRFLAAEEEGRWQQNPGAPASDGELGLAIAKELEMANLPVVCTL